MTATASRTAPRTVRAPSARLSWIATVIAIGSIPAWRAALVAWIDTSTPYYDFAEPFIGMWSGSVVTAILLLACAGAVTDRGWRALSAFALLPIFILGLLAIDGLIGGLRDGIISPAGLVFGMVSAGQLALLVAWLAFAIQRGRRIG